MTAVKWVLPSVVVKDVTRAALKEHQRAVLMAALKADLRASR
jgi:hypothetical protein